MITAEINSPSTSPIDGALGSVVLAIGFNHDSISLHLFGELRRTLPPSMAAELQTAEQADSLIAKLIELRFICWPTEIGAIEQVADACKAARMRKDSL